MKKLLFTTVIAISSLTYSVNAYSAQASLVSCDYEYIAEYGGSRYIGTYKSFISNRYFTRTFTTYCPQIITI